MLECFVKSKKPPHAQRRPPYACRDPRVFRATPSFILLLPTVRRLLLSLFAVVRGRALRRVRVLLPYPCSSTRKRETLSRGPVVTATHSGRTHHTTGNLWYAFILAYLTINVKYFVLTC